MDGQQMSGVNATQQAYNMLGAERYEAMCLELLCTGGTLIQDDAFLLAFRVEDGVARVLFACGDIKKIMLFAREGGRIFGFDRASWSRSLVGKRSDERIYNVERL